MILPRSGGVNGLTDNLTKYFVEYHVVFCFAGYDMSESQERSSTSTQGDEGATQGAPLDAPSISKAHNSHALLVSIKQVSQ